MFDEFRLKDVLVDYKLDFVSNEWANEKYKWEAIKGFQDNWDVNAEDFAGMLHRSLDKTFNLLASMNNFPRRMIEGFAKTAPEEVRAMFIALYDIYMIATAAENDESAFEKAYNGLQGWVDCFEKASLKGMVGGGGIDDANTAAGHVNVMKKAYLYWANL